MSPPRWPNGAEAAVSFTMDNLGEAQDVNKGTWPADVPIGQHYSVREKLPRMLDMLDAHGVRATYFAEAWSLDVYADVVAELRRRGHEVAWHGYQHEPWPALSPAEEELNFQKSFEAAEKAGVTYEGFRPPGGSVNEGTYGRLRERGVRYASPLGKLGIDDGVVVLPFEWRGVDAFYYMEKFAGIREAHGERKEVLSPSTFRDVLLAKVANVVDSGGYLSILFHPFLQTSEEKFAVMDEVLGRISSDPDIWCAPCNQVSQWVTEHASLFKPEE